MIRKLLRQMLSAQIFSALTVSLCLLIDSVMISRFLGENAIAAYSLSTPVLLAIGAVGTLLAAGIQVVCSRALGRGSQEEANAGFSSAAAAAAGISVAFAAVVIAAAPFICRFLGAGSSGPLFENTRDYLIGFSIGAPGSMGALVLVPFLQMAGQSGLLIAAVGVMTVTDVALDLLNVTVFNGGMLGMGLASACSYYAAMAVAAFYFLSKRSVFRFSPRDVSARRIRELFSSGIPAGVNMLSGVVLSFLMNRLLRSLGGSGALAAFAVIQSIGNSANCITTGVGGVSLTLCGIFFHEEDRTALRETVKTLCVQGVFLGLGVGILLAVFAPAMVSLFIAEQGTVWEMAVLGLRLFAAGLVPCCINSALKFAYQGTGRTGLMQLYSFAETALFSSLAAFALSRFMGTDGAWLYFAAGELLTLLAAGALIRKVSGRKPWEGDAFLLLKKDFGVTAEETLETDITTMEEVAAAAEAAERFCRARGQDARISSHIALCIEEMAGNVIRYGFQDGKSHHLSVRILDKKEYWVLRFRDDCRAFDPVHYVQSGNENALGIRLVMALAEEAHYTYSMNLNNLALKLPRGAADAGADIEQPCG